MQQTLRLYYRAMFIAALVVFAGCGGDEEETPAAEETPENNATNNEDQNNEVVVPEGCDTFLTPSDDDQVQVQEAFIDAAADGTICLAEGTFTFNQQLSLGTDGVTLRGAGQEVTILDFSGQDVGANGLRVTGDSTTLEDFRVVNTPGDGIRVDDAQDITFRRVDVLWDEEASEDNGAYGLYPVGCDGVLIEECLVVGARDAGIYVGQSKDIVVRNNEAHGNVAGIEIENSLDSDVYGNHAHDNTAGMLVFDLPDLDQFGARSKVHDNILENNNAPNFAQEGNIIARVPKGTGLLVMASDNNEVHDNIIRGNDSFGLAVVSFSPELTGKINDDPNYDIFPQGNWVHDNTFEGNGTDPDTLVRAISLDLPFPDMAWDGCLDPAIEDPDASLTNCFSNNGEEVTFLNFNLCGGPNDTDISPVTCEHEPLPEIIK